MTSCLHALRCWSAMQQLVAVDQGSVRECQDIHRILYSRLFWEHLLRRSAEKRSVILEDSIESQLNIPL
jgi:hypothetical protein